MNVPLIPLARVLVPFRHHAGCASLARASRGTAAVALLLATLGPRPALALVPQWILAGVSNPGPSRSIASADFNSDGRADMLTLGSDNAIRLVTTGAGGVPDAPVVIYQGTELSDVGAGDVNGDGRPDVVIGDVTNQAITVLLATPDNSFATPVTSTLGIAPRQLALVDVNRDGKLDVMVRTDLASVIVCAGSGTGSFQESSRAALRATPYLVEAADVDGDGNKDVVAALSSPNALALLYGRADGTLDAAVEVNGASAVSSAIRAADLDADGDAEIITCEPYGNTVTVLVNLGSRSFASATQTNASPYGWSSPYVRDLTVLDATGDGRMDVVVTLPNVSRIATLPGNGTGALAPPMFQIYSTATGSGYRPADIEVGDFSGDGKPDLIVQGGGYGFLFRNAAGEVTLLLQPRYPKITRGQSAIFTLTASTRMPIYGNDLPVSGSASLQQGSALVATEYLSQSTTFTVPDLAVGTHEFTATYDGNDDYLSSTSLAAAQTVIAERTTTTVVPNATSMTYGARLDARVEVTSELSGVITGSVYTVIDGVAGSAPCCSLPATWNVGLLRPGLHTLAAHFEGDAVHPPSVSANVTVSVAKYQPVVTLSLATTRWVLGQQPSLSVNLSSQGGDYETGKVKLVDGGSEIASASLSSNSIVLTGVVLAPGTHYLRATYEGDSNYEPAQSSTTMVTVIPSNVFVTEAFVSGTQVRVEPFNIPAGVAKLKLYRRVGSGPWYTVPGEFDVRYFAAVWTDPWVEAEKALGYRYDAFDANGQWLMSSKADVTVVHTWAEELTTSTWIRASHIAEIIDVMNVMRTGCLLAPLNIVDAGAGMPVRAQHVAQLRGALDEMRLCYGALPGAWTYAVKPGDVVRRAEFLEIREMLR